MNCYTSIADLKTALAVTSTTDDTVMRKIIDAASRMIDIYTGRHFYVQSATKYFDGAGSRLWVDDLLSINASGLKTDEDGDLDYDNTFVTTDYILYPLNTYPKTYIEISNDSDYGSFGGGVKKAVEIAGSWGYGDGISATPYITSNAVTYYALANTTGTAVDVAGIAATVLSPGQTILINTEQMFIESITPDTATVQRGVNGTTAATHLVSQTIYIYQYPYDVWQACLTLSTAIYQNKNKLAASSERLGDYGYTLDKSQANTIMNDTISGYRKVRV